MYFTAAKEERDVVTRIVARARALLTKLGHAPDDDFELEMEMDLLATHANGCPMDFVALESVGDADFGHDIGGIRRHMDRRTGKLGGCFVPRTAKRGGS